jgi:hypothetical protein
MIRLRINKMKPLVNIALLFVFILALSGIMGAIYMYNKPHKDFTGAKADYALSAEELQKEFGSDESAATGKYMNKTIEISGTISNINSNDGKVLSITFETGNEASSVICSMENCQDILWMSL